MSSMFGVLEVGTKIDIIKLNDVDVTLYPSQVLDIIKPKELIISGPIKKSELVILHKDEEIKISYNVENKGNYYFIAKILSRDYSSVYTLKIRRVSDINKIQLRNYYRLPITLDVNKEYLLSQDDKIDKLIETCECKDISGGGMKLYCNYEHKIGDKITCLFRIGDSPIEAKGLITRVEETNSLNYKYGIGVSFLEIKEEKRDIIIKYIFEQQRILRLKGMI